MGVGCDVTPFSVELEYMFTPRCHLRSVIWGEDVAPQFAKIDEGGTGATEPGLGDEVMGYEGGPDWSSGAFVSHGGSSAWEGMDH
jgi:hypothetical protein